MTIRLTLTICFIGLLISSCQKDLNLNQDDFESKLVINSVFSPDSVWLISVTNSTSILNSDSEITTIDDAQILLENRSQNREVVVESIGNGMYATKGLLPVEGQEYEIFVSKDGYQTARSFTYVPSNAKAPDLFSIEEVNTFSDKVYKVNLKIEDDPLRTNFYIWELVSSSGRKNAGAVIKGEELDELVTYLDTTLPTNQPKSGKLTALSSDGAFTGETYSEEFYIVPTPDQISDSSGGEQTNPTQKFYLKVRSVSQDLFKYHQSLKQYQEFDNVNTSISSPTQIYSNIEGGYGIFGSYSETIIALEL